MGTNYYWHPPKAKKCEHCGHQDGRPPIHIGKSSYGWVFALHVGCAAISESDGAVVVETIQGFDDWRKVWTTGHIEDEYGQKIPAEEMIAIITERGPGQFAPARNLRLATRLAFDLHQNCAKWDSEHQLLRSNSADCVGHGDTWDLIVGEFS